MAKIVGEEISELAKTDFSRVGEKLSENTSFFLTDTVELGAFGAQNHLRQLLLANLAKTWIFKLGESPSIVGEKKLCMRNV